MGREILTNGALEGTFGHVHYVNSSKASGQPTCTLHIMKDVAICFSNADGSYDYYKEKFLFVKNNSNHCGELLFFYDY
jgi:hypothetical protein